MGYYKQIDAEQQAEVDRVVRWWRDNHKHIPNYVMSRILADKKLLDDLMEAYEFDLFKSTRRVRKPKADWSMSHGQAKTFVLTMFILWAVAFALVVAGLVL